MVEVILKELKALREKVDAAIKHVEAGVGSLNEDQQSALKRLVVEIEKTAAHVTDEVHVIISEAEDGITGLVQKVKGALENAVETVEEAVGIAPKPVTLTDDLPPAIAPEDPEVADFLNNHGQGPLAPDTTAEETK